MKKNKIIILVLTVLFSAAGFWTLFHYPVLNDHKVGDPVDSLDGVIVYYNGRISNDSGRNLTEDNYNLGKKFQCVEFVKRYYYEHFGHKMPDSYGNAKDFYDPELKDGELNKRRDLLQYTNPSSLSPRKGDLLIFDGTSFNSYGHVAIISKVTESDVEIIQQNPGPNAHSRVNFSLIVENGKWKIDNKRILGWLRMK
jgi:hypothetical protein